MNNQPLEIDTATFKSEFPRRPFLIKHHLADHPLFTIPRLLELSKALPESCVEYNAGNIPVNMDYHASPRTGMSAEETIRRIRDARSWMVLKYVERDADYRALLDQCLDQIQGLSEAVTPGMYNREGFIFLTSPGSTTPFHIDPEHNFLLQIQGQKQVTQFDPADESVLSEADIERGLFGETRNLTFNTETQKRGKVFELKPGMGLHFPVVAPHWVKNGDDVSVSFSITFGSKKSEQRLGVHRLNMALRKRGLQPSSVGRSGVMDFSKFTAYRALRRLRLMA